MKSALKDELQNSKKGITTHETLEMNGKPYVLRFMWQKMRFKRCARKAVIQRKPRKWYNRWVTRNNLLDIS